MTARARVWVRSIAAARADVAALRALLTSDELQQMARFRQEADQLRFLVGRSLLRREVAVARGIAARDVAITFGPQGKPMVSGGPHVNVAHSGDVVVVALCDEAPIGVDVEEMLVTHVEGTSFDLTFSPAEIAAYQRLPESARVDAFFHLWTTKEALLKAAATGLSIPLQSFDVDADPTRAPALLVARCAELAGTVSVSSLAVPRGYRAAIAAFAPALAITYR